MKRLFLFLSLFAFLAASHAEPLRVFIRAGKKTHGPNQHEHERFLADWKVLLTERGIKTDGALDWPTAEQFKNTDVIIVHAQSGGDATEEQKAQIAEFTKRGGGLVVIHAAAVANDPPWWKSVVGGAWVPKVTKFKEGPMDLYFTENQYIGGGHPITRGASNFHFDDEIYYDMDLSPDIRVLATSYTPNVREGKKGAEGGKAHIYDIQPQMWAYEREVGQASRLPDSSAGAPPATLGGRGARDHDPAGGAPAPLTYRAFVTIPGHLYDTFGKPNYRAILLRGIAWAGKRANLDEFTKPEEIAALTYPPGGPQKPADTLANLEVHPDFTIKLVASEPLINKPMNFDWDPAGRLWVAETPEYPNGRRGMRPDYRGKEWKDHGGIDPTPGEQDRKAIDKISILTDTDGDGVMDKKDVFYEGLDLVTGLVFHKDGVIVTQAPDILWLRDTDGDGKADKVETLYHGLGTGDTHAVINNPRWGWDGWIYATHGYSGSDKVVNAKGEPMGKIGSGVVRFKPDGSLIEQYSSKGGNTWGLTITGDNRVMWTQPTSGTLLNHTVLPEYALARGKIGNTTSHHNIIGSQKSFPAMSWEQLAYVQIDRVGDFTAAAGCVIYDGGAWPEEYNGDYFTTEPTINLIHHERLTPEASSYAAHKLPGREETEFIRSKDMWWRPIEVRVGPDGAIYVADFYNQAVIHNDTRGPDHNKVNAAVRPDRDHYFGRIWKIEHKQAKKLPLPDLSKAGIGELARALESPNRPVRMTASRLLTERTESLDSASASTELVFKSGKTDGRIAALWTMSRLGSLPSGPFEAALASAEASLRRNVANVAEERLTPVAGMRSDPVIADHFRAKMAGLLSDADATVRLAALRAIAATDLDEQSAQSLIRAWPKFDDDYQRSAAIGAASRNPTAVIAAALDSADTAALAPLVSALTLNITGADDAAKLVVAVAEKPASADPLKRSILDGFAKNVNDAPEMTPQLSAALAKLLASGASGSALPLAAKWDKTGALKGAVNELVGKLFAKLANGSEPDRLVAAQSLIGLRSTNQEVFPAIESQLAKDKLSEGSKSAIVAAAGETQDNEAGAMLLRVYAKLPASAQTAAFDQLLKRSDWTTAFLDAVQATSIDVTTLGPANAFRLRSHPDKAVAARATKLLDELNPVTKAKKDAIAKLAPIVEHAGDAAKGKALFTTTCAICHEFGGAGAKIGPALTGMGSHGTGELLTAIVDPNAEVEPSFVAWNLETKDGQLFNGVIESENPTTITLKSLAGVQQIKVADVKKRENTGRSLMPEGFDGIGGETLRDIIAYMQSVDGGKFRTLDLRDAFTASTTTGLYVSKEMKRDSFVFLKTGTVNVEGVPFNIVGPDKAPLNILVLKGGPEKSYSHTQPARVEVKAGGFKANRLHFLGGVSGWGAKSAKEGAPVLKVIVHFADGATEELVMRDGVEFADYIGSFDVPGSRATAALVKDKQLRWFTKPLTRTAEIASLTLESQDSGSAPTLVAITAELADPNAPLPAVNLKGGINSGPINVAAKTGEEDAGFKPQFDDAVPQPPAAAKGPRVLLVGGGSSHDFVKFFGATDKATLTPHVGWVDFTQNANGVAPILKDIDVLVWSANQPVSSASCKALIDFANSGKGIIALHPGTWYAWKNFPDWNLQIVGGGTRGHDALGPFTVKVSNPAHPITKGVTPSFEITDELYNHIPDPAGTPIEVLAEATSPKSGKTFPQVFVVKHPKARIVGITLGHDARAHDLPEYQALLRNAVSWAAGK
jgi:putative membrane-bound dehydrogenase-like protein